MHSSDPSGDKPSAHHDLMDGWADFPLTTIVGTLLGVISGIGVFGFTNTSWRTIKFTWKSGQSAGLAKQEEKQAANAFVPTESELDILKRLRIQALTAPELRSPGSSRKSSPEAWLEKRALRRQILSITPTTTIETSPGSEIKSSPSDELASKVRPLVEGGIRTIDTGGGAGWRHLVIRLRRVASLTKVSSPCRSFETQTQRPLLSVGVVNFYNFHPSSQCEAETQTEKIESVEGKTQTELEHSEEGTQTEPVGATARWRFLVRKARRISFLRRTIYNLRAYVKEYDGLYTRSSAASSIDIN